MATLLVVSHWTMAPATTDLVSFKNRNKMPAALMTVNDFKSLLCTARATNIAPCAGLDDAAILKLGIDFFYRNRGTKYVLLAGDATLVPVRYATRYDTHWNDSATGFYSATDLYYANLYHHADPVGDIPTTYSPWDNGDGVYNLSAYWTAAFWFNPDNVDGYPDVAVGRVDVNTEAALANYVAKVESYETTTMAYASRGTFVEDAIYDNDNHQPAGDMAGWSSGMASDLFPSSSNNTFLSANYSQVITDSYWGNAGAWPLARPWQPATPQDVVNKAVASGIVTYFGHSAQDGWDSPNSLGYEALFSQTTQTNNFPMIFATACLSGTFTPLVHFASASGGVLPTNPTPNQLSAPPPAPAAYDAFSNYVLAKSAAGGGIAYAGLMETHEPGPDMDLYKMMAERFGAGEKTLGDMWRQAQQEYWHANVGSSATDERTDSNEWEIREPRIFLGELPLAGDPSLRMQRGNGPVR